MAKGKSTQGTSTPYKHGNDRAEKAIEPERVGSMSPDAERAAKQVIKKFGLD
jgi:hypothetical protein